MSPATFKAQIDQLTKELVECIRLCEDVRVYRRLGSTHENLDKLQSTLEDATVTIPDSYNSARNYVGAKLDLGDDTARSEMSNHIHDVQTRIRPRLRNVAHKLGPEKNRNPGFRELRSEWRTINDGVSQTIHSLSRRLEAEPERKTDARIPSKGLNELIDVVKNSWEEVIRGKKLVYVNMYDPAVMQYERPEGAFVKTLPGSRLRAPSWDRRSPRIPGREW